MCGIAGVVEPVGVPVDERLVRAMTDVQAHRGPDGDGVLCRGSIGLGHRRLAIIDLATGRQPMSSDDGRVSVVFNGEIYNFRELRRELEAHGHRFHTTSDTEVILRAYETYGADAVPRLRGMFAFAIVDERSGHVLLARDRLGIKPLVYAWDGRRLVFASELKAILCDRQVSRELDPDALIAYLRWHYVPAPRTIFRAVRKLPPASTLVLPITGGEPTLSRYWTLRFEPDQRRDDRAWIEELRVRLADAVRSHLVSDVPLGAFLSGGMDSSTVVALMAAVGGPRVRTFSIGFDEADFDEIRYARDVARRYGTEHHEMVMKPDAVDVVGRLAWQLDEPFADSSAIPTYCVSRVAREHVTVALSGDGGDENFAGYARYADALALHARWDRMPGSLARPLLRAVSRLVPVGAFGQARAGFLGADADARYVRRMTYERDETLRELVAEDLRPTIDSPWDTARLASAAADSGAGHYVSRLQAIDLHTYLPDDILAKVDRTSMLVSLETRVPLLDHQLVEFAATMPVHLKLRDGVGKWALRHAMADALPGNVLTRSKMGFAVPLGSWLRHELRELAHDLLLAPRSQHRGLFRPAAVERLVVTHAQGRRDYSARLWALMCLELWHRHWVDR